MNILIFTFKYQLLMTLNLILNSLDVNVICIIKDYLKSFPFIKEIELFQKPKVEYKVFQFHGTNFWGNTLYFWLKEGRIVFTESIFGSTKRNVHNSWYSQYSYCSHCSMKLRKKVTVEFEEIWHHWNIDCKLLI